MRRSLLLMAALSCVLVIPVFAQKHTHVPIDNCRVVADTVNLSVHYPNEGVIWESTGDDYVVEFRSGRSPCVVNGQETKAFKVGRHQASQACLPNPRAKIGQRYKYTITWINPGKPEKKAGCNDPVVIVNDGKGHIVPGNQLAVQAAVAAAPPPPPPGTAERAAVENHIDSQCLPALGSANLSKSDGTSLKWTDDADTFSMVFEKPAEGDQYPCLDAVGGSPNGSFSIGGVCFVNPAAKTRNGYRYTITKTTGDPCPEPKTATINVKE